MIKNKREITEHSFIVPIFNQNINIIIGKHNKVKSWLRSQDVKLNDFDSADAACFGVCDSIYLWFEPNPTIDIVAHEVAHSVFAIMKSRGLDIEDEELFCYLQEFIINNVLQCVKVTLPTVMDPINQKSKQVVEHQS